MKLVLFVFLLGFCELLRWPLSLTGQCLMLSWRIDTFLHVVTYTYTNNNWQFVEHICMCRSWAILCSLG